MRWRRYRVMFCTFCMSLFSLLYMFVINAFPWLAWEEFTVTTRPIKMYVKKICEWNFDCDTHPLAWESVMWKKISLFVVIITVALVIFLHHLLDFFSVSIIFHASWNANIYHISFIVLHFHFLRKWSKLNRILILKSHCQVARTIEIETLQRIEN